MNQLPTIHGHHKGILIAVEGIDCCGKSTQAVRIHNWASAYGQVKVAPLTKEPTSSHFGKRIRKILGDKELFYSTDPFDLQELFAKDSRLHCKEIIIPALQRSELVCSDRFRPSMVFGAEKGNLIDLHMLMEMNIHYLGPYFVWPDAVFIFDVPPDLAIERRVKAGRAFDQMEQMETFIRVRENYKLFAGEYPNCHIIPTFGIGDNRHYDRPVEDIFLDVRKILEELLKAKRAS